MFEIRQRQISPYRSIRYNSSRKESFTADPQSLTKYRTKKVSLIETTECKTDHRSAYTSQKRTNNPQKTNYLETFRSLMSSKHQGNNDEIKNYYTIDLRSNNFDDVFDRNSQSQFTLLDPFQRPLSYVQKEVDKSEKELRSQRDQIKMIKSQLAIMKYHVITSLKNSQDEGKRNIEKLRGLIKKNEVQEHERKLRTRKQITQLFEADDKNKELEKNILQRMKDMQDNIFNCQPYELQQSMIG